MAGRQSIISLNDSVPVYRYRFYSGVDLPLPSNKERNIYRRRWIVVLIFCVFALIQGSEFNTWWYSSDITLKLYHWTEASVTLSGCVGAFAFFCALVPVAKIIGRFGHRCTVIQASLFLTIGAFFRYWFATDSFSLTLSVISSIIVGICGAVTFLGPTEISANWFPRKERFLATGLMLLTGTNLALCSSFVVTDCLIPKLISYNESRKNDTADQLQYELGRIYLLELIACCITTVVVLVFFPNRPPTPPSFSSQLPRLPFNSSVREAVSNSSFWILLFTRAVPLVSQVALLRALRFEMHSLGISPSEGMWLGPSACLIGTLSGLVMCFVAGRFPFRIRSILAGLNVAAGIACFFLTLTCYRVLAPDDLDKSRGFFFAFVIITVCFSSATIPLYAELTCEVTFAAHEAAVQSLHGLGMAVVWALAFSYIPLTGFWILTVLSATFLTSVPLAFFVQHELSRTIEDFECNDL